MKAFFSAVVRKHGMEKKMSSWLLWMHDCESGRSSSPLPCVQGFPSKVQMTGIFCALGKDIYYYFPLGNDTSSNFFAFYSFLMSPNGLHDTGKSWQIGYI